MSADENGPCFHCELSVTLQALIKMHPKKECVEVTGELVELLSNYVASTAPAGELESAVLIVTQKFQKMVRSDRQHYIDKGWVKEATVQ